MDERRLWSEMRSFNWEEAEFRYQSSTLSILESTQAEPLFKAFKAYIR